MSGFLLYDVVLLMYRANDVTDFIGLSHCGTSCAISRTLNMGL